MAPVFGGEPRKIEEVDGMAIRFEDRARDLHEAPALRHLAGAAMFAA